MALYDKILAKNNADKINTLIDNFLKNIRLIGELTSEIMQSTINKYPEVLSEDERKCIERENVERSSWVQSQIEGRTVTSGQKAAYEREAVSKFRKIRMREAYILLQEYRRLSHILDIGGYNWDKFFKKENDEPAKERLIRETMDDDDARDEYRHLAVCNFIKYSYEFWPVIKNKDIDFLTNHLNALFPDSEYTDKLEIIYGNNDAKKTYISDKDLERIWRMIHATIKTSIKYMLYIGRTTFHFTTKVDDVDVVTRSIVVNVQDQMDFWAVNPEVR